MFKGVRGRRRALSLPLFGLSLLPLLGPSGALAGGAAAAAPVLPTGGRVAAGSAVVGGVVAGAGGRGLGGASLTVSQSSSKAILDWTGFSIGSGGTVRFDNGSGATLNRVTGTSLSSIQGLLSATGSVYLINPNGVIIGRSGVVDVGGRFVASTLDVADGDFLAGGALSFTGPSTASVVNLGRVGALGGDVALVGARVDNDGTITAVAGEGALIAGSRVLMRDASLDGGRFAVLAGGSATSATNRGTIQAADAELRAEGGSVYALAGDTSGVERASGIQVQGTTAGQGRVWLVADGGTLEVSGQVVAQGVGGTAGAIETSGGTVKLGQARIDAHGGVWTVDPYDLTIDATAAASLSASLNAGTSVVEQTTAGGTSGAGVADASGSGDIYVAAPISWSTPAALTLSAYRDIDLEAPITASGAGALTLITDNTGAGNGGAFNALGGSVRFTGGGAQPGGSLRIGVGTATPVAYTLVADLATLSADIAANNSGAYALARPIDAGQTSYSTIPLASTETTAFAGRLEGLGNTISNLTLNDSTDTYVGLFGMVGSSGVIANLGMIGGSITATLSGLAGDAANLVAYNFGSIEKVYASGNVNSEYGSAGGLVVMNYGLLSNASASGSVSAPMAGGIVAINAGTLSSSYATGNVGGKTSSEAGGLVAENQGQIIDSYATGSSQAGTSGGLAGYNNSTIINSYSTASASGAYVGGLVGINVGTINATYATGKVSETDDAFSGGLISENSGGMITNSFYDQKSTGQTVGIGSPYASQAGVTATEGATNLSSYNTISYSGLQFGSLGSGAAWVIVDSDGTLNNAGGAAGGTRPLLLSEYSTTITNAHQLQLVDLNLAANYTIANNIDASETGAANPSGVWSAAGFVPLGPFSGVLDGGGHIVSNLSIITTTPGQVGLFSVNSGLIENVNLRGGQVDVSAPADGSHVGALVGDNYGTLSNDSATTSVSDDDSAQSLVGGLVGFNVGAVAQSYATGAVLGGNGDVGGLVGDNTGSIVNSYSAGDVTADGAPGTGAGLVGYAGGLVGVNDQGRLTSVYATGAVKAGVAAGLVASNDFGTITGAYASGEVSGGGFSGGIAYSSTGQDVIQNAFYDQGTTGQSLGVGYTGGDVANPPPPSQAGVTAIGGRTGLSPYSASSYAGLTFGALGSGAGWVIVDNDGSINNAGGASGGTRPFLLSEYSTNVTIDHQLQLMVLAPAASYTLAGDIGGAGTDGTDLSRLWTSAGFVPIGTSAQPFTGIFDGQGHSISGLFINRPGQDDVGLFGVAGSTAVLTSVTLQGGAFTGRNDVGALVGFSGAALADDVSTATVEGSTAVGGLVGSNGRAVSDSYATGAVSSPSGKGGTEVGGLAGVNYGPLQRVSASGAVQGNVQAGGLIGFNDGDVLDSYATGAVSGGSGPTQSEIGGLAGQNAGALTRDSADGAVEGYTQVGGLVGLNNLVVGFDEASVLPGTITGGSAKGTVSGRNAVGGLVGENDGFVARSFATGDIVGYKQVGGLIGNNSGDGGDGVSETVALSYATGDVSVASGKGTPAGVGGQIGGLIGENAGLIGASYSTGAVRGLYQVGGLIGSNDQPGDVSTSYATGAVHGASNKASDLGGLAGYNDGSIANAYATGAISGGSGKGGLVALSDVNGTVQTSYAAGATNGGAGLVAINKGVLSQSFFDEATTGTTIGVGSGSALGVTAIGGSTGLGPDVQSTYAGFDFNATWTLQPGASRPYLQAQPQSPPPT